MTKPPRAKRIADPNDKFRKSLVTNGRTYMTAGVNSKGPEFVARALVIAFDDFNADIILATMIVLVATPVAIHLLANDKPLYGLTALVTALGAAFGPKIYADFIQPKASPATSQDY